MTSIDYLLSQLDDADEIKPYRLDPFLQLADKYKVAYRKTKPFATIRGTEQEMFTFSIEEDALQKAALTEKKALLPEFAAEFEEAAVPEKESSVEILTDILCSLPEYEQVTVQRIMHQHETRIPVSVVYFTYKSDAGTRLGRLFVKNYEGNEHLRRKDTVLPMFYNELGIPTPTVLGFDPEKGYDHKFALFVPPSIQQPAEVNQVITNQIGKDDFATLSKALIPESLVEHSIPVIEMAVKLQILGTINNQLLKDKYGFTLEKTHDDQLMRERLLQYLRAGQDSVAEFVSAYHTFCSVLPQVPGLHCHGDFTDRNVRIDEYIENCYPIDFELARDNASLTEDVVMFGVSCVGKRDDRSDIQDMMQEKLRRMHFASFEEAVSSIPGAHGFACTHQQFELSSAGELIKAHLFKIGDQIWIQDRHGRSNIRENKAMWHLESLLRASDAYCSMQPDSAQVLNELKSATANLFRNNSNTPYLKPVTSGV